MSHQVCIGFRAFYWIALFSLLVLGLSGSSISSAAVMMSAENVTIQAGSSGQVTVRWASTDPINYLVTGLLLERISGDEQAVRYGVGPDGVPSMPPLLDPNYVFSGNSFAVSLLPSNPASVSQTNYAADTYTMGDGTLDFSDYSQDGTRVWTVLNLTADVGKSGVYRLVFQNSQYDFSTSGGTPIDLQNTNLIGGIITIENNVIVPEPASFVMGFAGCLGLAWRHRKNSLSTRR